MFLLVLKTEILGVVPVPEIFFLTLSFRLSIFVFLKFTLYISYFNKYLLLSRFRCFSGLSSNFFARVSYSFTFVGFGFPELSYLRGCETHQIFLYTFNCQCLIFPDLKFNTFRSFYTNRV